MGKKGSIKKTFIFTQNRIGNTLKWRIKEMLYRKFWICVAVLLLAASGTMTVTALTPQEQLGKDLFFDQKLSNPPGQECAECHGPSVGYTGPDSAINAHGAVYPGAANTATDKRFGNRKPPAAAYAGASPILGLAGKIWIGGMFWDGRATGWRLGDPLAEQALGPFLNPLEQNLANPGDVVSKVEASSYAGLFTQICGGNNIPVSDRYDCIGISIAAYERSTDVSSFTSRYDQYLAGTATLTNQEKEGLKLFNTKGKCDKCHVSQGAKPLFTDYSYDNLGIPKNTENPFYTISQMYNPLGAGWIDTGLGGFLSADPLYFNVARAELGKEKVPTLRNVDKRPSPDVVKAYGHNGYFKSLKSIVHFYNTRDVIPVCGSQVNNPGVDCWPMPEIALNMNTKELGNLGLSPAEEDAIVAFLGTLSDQ